ncbi:restriction endonuclease [Xanthomonas arboricola]|uniref:restriction endonuclease n=1 Tax=Xanthomonas arboricola TaxID=56448 RepID=UPI003EBC63D5
MANRTDARWLLSQQSSPPIQGLNQGISTVLAPSAWMKFAVCCLTALTSFAGSYQRRRLLDTRTALGCLAANSWRQFELLVGEAFRRQGHALKAIGLIGTDVGIELILRRSVRCTLLQCKQWKHQQVSLDVVREIHGLLASAFYKTKKNYKE